MGKRGPRPTFTKQELLAALLRHRYRVIHVAAEAGLTRQAVYQAMAGHGISRRLSGAQRSRIFELWWADRRAKPAAA